MEPQGTSRAPSGLSLGAKFVGLTAGLILLLSVTALISLRNSAQTVSEIETVVEFAIPAYGALARSHIRSLEQAVELRRALLLAETPTRLKAMSVKTQNQLMNWGYAVCDAALRRYVPNILPPGFDTPPTFPFPGDIG